jgi:hypothetical protein
VCVCLSVYIYIYIYIYICTRLCSEQCGTILKGLEKKLAISYCLDRQAIHEISQADNQIQNPQSMMKAISQPSSCSKFY